MVAGVPIAALAAPAVLLPGLVSADIGVSTGGGDPASVPDIVPSDPGVGPVAHTGEEYKFDDGFYQRIQDLIDEDVHVDNIRITASGPR